MAPTPTAIAARAMFVRREIAACGLFAIVVEEKFGDLGFCF